MTIAPLSSCFGVTKWVGELSADSWPCLGQGTTEALRKCWLALEGAGEPRGSSVVRLMNSRKPSLIITVAVLLVQGSVLETDLSFVDLSAQGYRGGCRVFGSVFLLLQSHRVQ